MSTLKEKRTAQKDHTEGLFELFFVWGVKYETG